MARLKRATATGLIVSGPCYLKSVTLTPAAAVATVSVDDSSDGSATDLLSLQAAANGESVIWVSQDKRGVAFQNGVHITVGGAGAAVSVEVEP
jgi:hypothetical protein